jgi:DNA gyrase subunit B
MYLPEIQQAEIEVKDFPECVRLRKGMYIWSKEHQIDEFVTNGIDEINEGYGNAIAVGIVNGVVSVEDNGRGIPVTPSSKFPEKSQAEVAYTVLHAGGKFGGSGGYKSATGGLHGVGASCGNALSEWLELNIKTGGNKYQLKFEKGITTQPLTVIEEGVEGTGTEVIFKFDDSKEIWNNEPLDIKKIKKRLQQLAFLNPGVLIYFYVDTPDKEGKQIKLEESYQYPEGIQAYVAKLTKDKYLVSDIIGTRQKVDDIEVSIAFAYTESYSEETITFCNNISTSEGGDHLTGFKMGVKEAIMKYADMTKAFKEGTKIEIDDTREGIVAIVSVKVNEPEFEGQNKSKVKMAEVRTAVKQVAEQFITDYLDQNPDKAKAIMDKVSLAVSARNAARKAREAERNKKDLNGSQGLPGKLADCSDKTPENCEIYLVEGDSAAGSAKQGRDRRFQAILPVFGKVMNSMQYRIDKILKSDKMMDAVKAFKCGIDDDFDISKLRYHKIIIMSDADVDGAHIKTLWLTFFYCYMRQLLEEGNIFFACPPLFKIESKKNISEDLIKQILPYTHQEYDEKKHKKIKVFYVYTDEERDAVVSLLGEDNVTIQRYKGLGEMNPDQLWETTMNPETRTLIQITMEDAEAAAELISICMGEKVEPRRDFITENAHYATIDA